MFKIRWVLLSQNLGDNASNSWMFLSCSCLNSMTTLGAGLLGFLDPRVVDSHCRGSQRQKQDLESLRLVYLVADLSLDTWEGTGLHSLCHCRAG